MVLDDGWQVRFFQFVGQRVEICNNNEQMGWLMIAV
jgi:hypothetical protein